MNHDDYEQYEYEETITPSPEVREELFMNFTNSLTSLLQSGVRLMYIGENLEDNELYFVCADMDPTFVGFICVAMDDEGNMETNVFIPQNDDFDTVSSLIAPTVIEDCTSFEDFLEQAGISVTEAE